ncbi:multiheme c-type cytochrome [Melioribacter sp. OK-6-Me]|uniref:multiheme c-type cytochrome n=1 Tax=unclassified Melioribacter TaxID=2627329 RepID=UPI003EDB18BB
MFRNGIHITILVALCFFLISGTSMAQGHAYTGVESCGMCHKTEKQGEQLKIWQNSKHANAYKTLMTEEANKLSGEVKAVENPKCLKCHASGYDVDPKLLGKKFSVADGVQCETCHGPGEDYKSMKVMKNREEAVKNGLIIWKDEAEIEKNCKTCHNEESPTYKEFNFAQMWPKIAHPVPKK